MRLVILYIFLSFAFFLQAENLTTQAELPLGLAFDGKILWVADSRQKSLMGYDFDEKNYIRPKPITITAIRDLSFYYPHLITVYPNYLAFINPINGDVVERQQLTGLEDPVSVAVHQDIAYIAERKTQKIYRYNLKERVFLGTIPLFVNMPRGMTFFRGFLWLVDKENRVNKISPETGEILSYIPVVKDSYGVSFIAGSLYVSRPFEVVTVDYIETENFVASAEKKYEFRGLLQFVLPWPKEQMSKELKLNLRFSLLPNIVRQRIQKLQIHPAHFRLQRTEIGEHKVQINFKNEYSENPYRISGQVSLYNITYFFNSANMKLYFKETEIPEAARFYLEKESFRTYQNLLKENLRQIKKEFDGRHPIIILPKLSEFGFKSLPEEILALRHLGIPARSAVFWDRAAKKTKVYLQLYIPPMGWVTRSELYNPERPREFPLSHDHFELFYPESLSLEPLPRNEKGEVLPFSWEKIVEWQSLELAERSD